MGMWMLSESAPTFLMHLRKVMDHFISNGCLSLYHSIQFPCKEGTRNLVLCVQFEARHQCECHNVNNNGCIDALKSSSDLTYTSKEGYETLHQQYIPLLTVYCPASNTWRVPQIWHFVCNLRVNVYINSTIWFIRGQYMVSKASTICFMNTRKDMKHFISNEYLSLQHSIPFLVLIGYPKSGFLYIIWESTYAEMTWYDP